jgi:succinoglycan biosynthesis protein ExoA
MRIVIADGGSSDKTSTIAGKLAKEFDNVVFLYNPKRVQSAAVNLAVESYGKDAEFLIRIDAHATYPADYCKILLEEAEQTQASSVVVAMHTVGTTCFQQAVAAAQNSKIGNGGSAHRSVGTKGMWVDHGHHALMRIDAFRKIRGYDESFSHNEDAELDTRLTQAGFRIWMTGKTALTYYPRSAPISLFQQYADYGHGRARHIRKHKARPKLRQLAPAFVVPAALLLLGTPFTGLAALPFMLWALLCLTYGVVMGVQARNRCIAAAGPAAMIMHFGWSVGFWEGIWAAPRGRRHD